MEQLLISMTAPLLRSIQCIADKLHSLPHLYPNPEVNGLFHNLVNTVQAHDSLNYEHCIHGHNLHDLAKHLQHACSTGEFALEQYWSNKIFEARNSRMALATFPYFQNYQQLMDLEASQLPPKNKGGKILFVGSGPLPLSAILLTQTYGWQVDCLDYSSIAYQQGKDLSKKLAIRNINFIHGDILQYTELKQYQAVIVGALVGENSQEKEQILKHIHQHIARYTKVLVRSSHGLRELLYPSIELATLGYWQIEKAVHPKNEIINSIIVLCKN